MPKKPTKTDKPKRPRGRPMGWRKPEAERISKEFRIVIDPTEVEHKIFMRLFAGATRFRAWLRDQEPVKRAYGLDAKIKLTAEESEVFHRIGGADTIRAWLREILEKL